MISQQKKNIAKALIGLIIIIHVIPYGYNRSLWFDEAMLASSIMTRNYTDLVAFPLDWGQSAPVGYLYIVKALSNILGGNEFSLRLWSLISFLGCFFFLYKILHSVVQVKHPLLFALVFGMVPYYIYYSNELKQYMSDNMFVLLSLLLFGLYCKGNLSLLKITMMYSVIIWFSFSAVFYIAACMIIIVSGIIVNAIKKNKLYSMLTLKKCSLCLIVAASFIVNYCLWLSPTSENAGGSAYWDLLRFRFFPISIQDIKFKANMFSHILRPILSVNYIFLYSLSILSLLSLYKMFRTKGILCPYLGAIMLGCFMMLVASNLGFFPIQDRLVQFIPILIIISAAIGFDEVEKSLQHRVSLHIGKKKISGDFIAICALLCWLLIVPFRQCIIQVHPEFVYRSGSEVSASMEYLSNNLRPEDMIYVSRGGIPVFLYETNYQYTDNICQYQWSWERPCTVGQCIYGQDTKVMDYRIPYSYAGHLNDDAIAEDTELLRQYPSVYIFTSHNDDGAKRIAEALEQYGSVQEVSRFYNTSLYYYSKKQS